jgi:hypothetical protein
MLKSPTVSTTEKYSSMIFETISYGKEVYLSEAPPEGEAAEVSGAVSGISGAQPV